MTFWFRTWWLCHFISCYLKVHFMLIKYTCGSKSQTLCMRYPFQSTGRPISHLNVWAFRVYMIPLRDFVPEWNSGPGARTGVNSRRGDSCRDNIFWWYHVNKYRAKRGNRSELALGRKWPRCHVNTPLYNQGEEIFKTTPEWAQFSQGGQRKRKKKTMKRWPKNSHDNLD